MRLALVLAVVLAGCAAPRPADPLPPPPAGLSDGQVTQLLRLGQPVLIPEPPPGFRLAVFEVNQAPGGGTYRLSYAHANGTCFEVSGTTDDLGGPDRPLVSREVRLARVPGQPAVRVYEAADDPGATSAQVWGLNTIVSDEVAVGAMRVLFLSDTVGGCSPVSLVEGAAIVAGLRPLGGDGFVAGPPSQAETYAPAPDVLARYNSGSTPEVAARAIGDRYEADQVDIDLESEADGEAVVVLTAFGLADDSVRDERLRLFYRDSGVGTWELVDVGRQVRCQAGRGHLDWGPGLCQ